jgi:hypothetical protein
MARLLSRRNLLLGLAAPAVLAGCDRLGRPELSQHRAELGRVAVLPGPSRHRLGRAGPRV